MALGGPSYRAPPAASTSSDSLPSRLCLSCFSSIPTKSSARAYITECCARPICYNCLAVNPRLREYVPCLSCGDGVQASKARNKSARRSAEHQGAHSGGLETSRGQFSLGADSDEEDFEPRPHSADSPPPYEDMAAVSGPLQGEHSSQISINERDVPAINEEHERLSSAASTAEENEGSDDEPMIEPIQHMVMRGDTVRGLATRYGLDPYEILKINSLPFEALQSNPQLVQTRKFLYLSQPTAKDRAGGVQVAGGSLSAVEEDETRQQQRKIKRFQLVTKEADTSVARAYLALEEMESAGGSKSEVLFSLDDEEKPGEKAAQADPDGRAVDRFFDDNQWEEAQQKAGPSAVGAGRGPRARTEKRAIDSPVKSGRLLQGAPWLAT